MEKLFLKVLAELGMTPSNCVVEYDKANQNIHIGWIGDIKGFDTPAFIINVPYVVLNDWAHEIDEYEGGYYDIEEHGRLYLNDYAIMYAYKHIDDWEFLHA